MRKTAPRAGNETQMFPLSSAVTPPGVPPRAIVRPLAMPEIVTGGCTAADCVRPADAWVCPADARACPAAAVGAAASRVCPAAFWGRDGCQTKMTAATATRATTSAAPATRKTRRGRRRRRDVYAGASSASTRDGGAVA
jgi:hypothetical protein